MKKQECPGCGEKMIRDAYDRYYKCFDCSKTIPVKQSWFVSLFTRKIRKRKMDKRDRERIERIFPRVNAAVSPKWAPSSAPRKPKKIEGVFPRVNVADAPKRTPKKKVGLAALHFTGVYCGDSRASLDRDLDAAISSPILPGGNVEAVDAQVLDNLSIVVTVDFRGMIESAQGASTILRKSLEKYRFKLD